MEDIGFSVAFSIQRPCRSCSNNSNMELPPECTVIFFLWLARNEGIDPYASPDICPNNIAVSLLHPLLAKSK